MSVVAVSTVRTQASGAGLPPARGASPVAFKDLLKSMCERDSGSVSPLSTAGLQPAALQHSDTRVVRPGDCLSRICSAQLRGQGGAVSQREISTAVKAVAKANHIADPDKIYAGQTLDLTVLGTFASGGDLPKAATVHENATQWKTLAQGAVALSSGFGLRKDPFTGLVRHHNGIDVVAPAGAAISPFAAGTVSFSGWKPGYGNTVIIRHEDGLESVYGHISKSLVQVGDSVTCHTPIGCVGSTGRSTGTHLHFEVRRNGQALNPIPLLNGNSVQVAQTAWDSSSEASIPSQHRKVGDHDSAGVTAPMVANRKPISM